MTDSGDGSFFYHDITVPESVVLSSDSTMENPGPGKAVISGQITGSGGLIKT